MKVKIRQFSYDSNSTAVKRATHRTFLEAFLKQDHHDFGRMRVRRAMLQQFLL
jgi:hypothetical protein